VKPSGFQSFENCIGPLSTLTPSNCVSTGRSFGFEREDWDDQRDFRKSAVLKPRTALMGAMDKIHFSP
jgi:hypothetical protein